MASAAEHDSEDDGSEYAEESADQPRRVENPRHVLCAELGCKDLKIQMRRSIRMLETRLHVRAGQLDERTRELQERTDQLQELTLENDALQRALEQLGPKRRKTARTWPRVLQEGMRSWAFTYKLCCKEENMSCMVWNVHPQLQLVPPGQASYPGDEDVRPGNLHAVLCTCTPGRYLRHFGTIVNPTVFERIRPIRGFLPWVPKPFPFERLPPTVQAAIFKHALHVEGQLIHCVSRFDPFVMPRISPNTVEGRRSGLPARFYWGDRECSITRDTKDPNEVLALLLVSRRFFWVGVHVFYALNTFAFSSLGEMGRFFNGIGDARLERIAHIELLWVGNQHLTYALDGKKQYTSRRTESLGHLASMRRLETLVVHVNETDKFYMRRRHEPEEFISFWAGKTNGQPNCRRTRSMRTTQGMDYVYGVRGLRLIRFYDFQKARDVPGSRVEIHDGSFMADLRDACLRPKVPSRAERSRLENLMPLLNEAGPSNRAWLPDHEDFGVVKRFYNTQSFDDVLCGCMRGVRDADTSSSIDSVAAIPNSDDGSDETATSPDAPGPPGPPGPSRPSGPAHRSGSTCPSGPTLPSGSPRPSGPSHPNDDDAVSLGVSSIRSGYDDGVMDLRANSDNDDAQSESSNSDSLLFDDVEPDDNTPATAESAAFEPAADTMTEEDNDFDVDFDVDMASNFGDEDSNGEDDANDPDNDMADNFGDGDSDDGEDDADIQILNELASAPRRDTTETRSPTPLWTQMSRAHTAASQMEIFSQPNFQLPSPNWEPRRADSAPSNLPSTLRLPTPISGRGSSLRMMTPVGRETPALPSIETPDASTAGGSLARHVSQPPVREQTADIIDLTDENDDDSPGPSVSGRLTPLKRKSHSPHSGGSSISAKRARPAST